MASILGYGCSTTAGPNSRDLWGALVGGVDHRSFFADDGFRDGPRAFLWHERKGLARERLIRNLRSSYFEMLKQLDGFHRGRLEKGKRLGVIFASTKGDVDDFIWDPDANLKTDGLTPVMDEFLNSCDLLAARKVVVSNACTSGLSALFLAEKWLNETDLDDVLIISADTVGLFVLRGFECLRVLTLDAVRPFSGERTGFHLGDAAAAILVSREPGPFSIRGVGVDAEGFAVTRPAQSGDSLKRACLMIPRLLESPPDVILAHGTATKVNDQIEDVVYTALFGQSGDSRPLVTGSKWCVGHTLGASGAVDLVVAMMMIEKNRAFALANTALADSSFHSRYLTAGTAGPSQVSSVLVSSLGFGGIHAAAFIERGEK